MFFRKRVLKKFFNFRVAGLSAFNRKLIWSVYTRFKMMIDMFNQINHHYFYCSIGIILSLFRELNSQEKLP